ncbi:hypothetical protein [Streptomyces sp. NBC_01594]|uniref:hypothetical protein n=1 Tax=Streptomyces sp. NBC_01594 TaxID=2975890 RepID=UPI0038670909
MDPADAYVRLYDALNLTAGSDLDDWDQEPGVDEIALRVCAEILDDPDGQLRDKWVESGLAPRPELLGVLLGLDLVMEAVHPNTDFLDGRSLDYLRTRLEMFGRLNSDETYGALLFRHRHGAGRPFHVPQKLDDLLSLIRIPASSNIHVDVLREADDLPDPGLHPEDDPSVMTSPRIELAQLPFLAEANDLIWEARSLRKRNYYTVQPDSSRMKAHISAALAALDDSGASLAFLPEASLDDDILTAWRDALRTRPDPTAGPTWLMVGTGPVLAHGTRSSRDRRPNRAVLLNRRGDPLLIQDKQRGFTLTPKQQNDYGLRIGEPPPVMRGEYHVQATGLSLIESRYGRFGIHICEDVGWHEMRGAVIAAGVTHLLVPVLAAPIADQGWQEQAAMDLVKEAGTDVAVSNGLAIARTTYEHEPATTLLLIKVPPDHTDDRYLSRDEMVSGHRSPLDAGAEARADALAPRRTTW